MTEVLLDSVPGTVNHGRERSPLKIIATLAKALGGVGIVALACTPAVVEQPKLASSAASGLCKNDETIPVLGSDKTITRGEYLKIVEELLRRNDPFVDGRSFADVMSGLGYTVGDLQQNCPGIAFEAREEGSYRRLRPVPPSSNTHNVPLSGLEVNWGWWYRSYGLLPVTDTKTGENTYFSLAEPWEPAEGIQWPTFVREGDEYPHLYRRYTQPVYPFPTSDSRQLYPNYTKDRAIDWGKGVIGPNLADQRRFNTPK